MIKKCKTNQLETKDNKTNKPTKHKYRGLEVPITLRIIGTFILKINMTNFTG
mgnify:FL=1